MNKTDDKKVIFLKWGLLLVACFFIAPYIFIAIGGAIGLVVAAAIAYIAWKFAPVFAMKVANAAWGARVNEAKENRIETLLNILREKAAKLNEAKKAIEDFAGQLGTFRTNITETIAKYPARKTDLEMLVDRFSKVLDMKKSKYRAANESLTLFRDKVEEARVMHEIAVASQKLSDAMGENEDALMDDILAKIAFDSVNADVHKSFTELDMALLEEAPAIK